MMNNEQKKAVQCEAAVQLVVAGAGTGKTTTIIEKILYLVENKHVKPEEILLLTFSRKAGQELRDRVAARAGVDCKGLWAGTFHSFCLHMIREYSDVCQLVTGYAAPSRVLDADQSQKIKEQIIMNNRSSCYGLPLGAIMRLWDRWLKDESEISRIVPMIPEEFFRGLQRDYLNELLKAGLADFEMLICDMIMMLEQNADFRRALHKRFRYIMVDEFQDTSNENYRLVQLMRGEKAGLFMVGDDAQSIYRFRGAEVRIMTGLHLQYDDFQCHVLHRNYRSHSEIVRAANRLIGCNSNQIRKKLIAEKGRGGSVNYHLCVNIEDEAEKTAEIIHLNAGKKIVVLYRNNEYGLKLKRMSGCESACNVEWMTMHASKGLEFENVIIAGVFEGMVPSPFNDIEEERRLFYVAVTRAKRRLHVLFRSVPGSQTHPFVQEMRLGKVTKTTSLLHFLQHGS